MWNLFKGIFRRVKSLACVAVDIKAGTAKISRCRRLLEASYIGLAVSKGQKGADRALIAIIREILQERGKARASQAVALELVEK